MCSSVLLWILAALIASFLYQPGLAGRSQKFQVGGTIPESVSLPVTVGSLALAERHVFLFRVKGPKQMGD